MSEEGRYFITTRSEFAKEIQPERYLGRFRDRKHAEYRANTKARDWGECVELRKETPKEASLYAWKRGAIRSARVFFGLLLGLITYGLLVHGHTGIGDTPFSQLTLSMVTGAIFRTAVAIGLFWLSWVLAFGPGPKDP